LNVRLSSPLTVFGFNGWIYIIFVLFQANEFNQTLYQIMQDDSTEELISNVSFTIISSKSFEKIELWVYLNLNF
jgi:hypothetical protein